MNDKKDVNLHKKFQSETVNQELFRCLVSNIKDYAIFMLDTTGHILTWNLGAQYIKGYTSEEIIGKHISVFYTNREIQKGEPEYNLKRTQQEGRFETENWRVRKDGSKFWANIVFTAIYDDQKQLKGYSKITRDVSERKKFEEEFKRLNRELAYALKEKTQQLSNVFDRVTDAFIALDKNWNYTYVNKKAAEIIGRRPKEIIGKNIWTEFPEKTKYSYYKNFQKAFDEQTPIRVEDYYPPSDLWFQALIFPSPDGITVYLHDISDRKKAELELIESEQKYRTIIETAQEGIWQIDENDRITFVNKYMANLLGYTPEEMIGKNGFLFIDESAKSKAIKNIDERRKGFSSQHELTFFNKNRQPIHTLIQSTPIFNKDKYAGSLSMVLDITKRKKAEEELRSSERKYRVLFEDNPLPMLILEYPERNFVAVNNGFVEKFGYSRKELSAMNIRQLRRPDEIHKSEEVERTLIHKHHFKGTMYLRKKDGTDLLFEVNALEILFEGKRVYIGSFNDITEQEKAKEDLEQTNMQLRELASHLQNIREEERTSMAREIHDELGQQLTAIKMDISWLNKKLSLTDETHKQKIKALFSLIDNTIHTVRRISSTLRPSVLDDLGLAEAIKWQITEFINRSGIQVNFSSNASEQKFPADITIGVFRIFQESLTNIARHAHATLVICELQKLGSCLILKITDNGVGFDINQKSKRKTLGLLGIKERIAMLNGKYEIKSEIKKGTVVSVKIPILEFQS
ncbi:MAG: domain S-box protein [Chitinophagaceae bacterium]|nr:domain S-box protein [Chitinophagaceae bacterium]